MVGANDSENLHIVEIAKNANVGIPTIYYHFDSLAHLIAEAQLVNYLELAEPLHLQLTEAEDFLEARNELAFWDAIEENLIRVWSPGQLGNKIGLLRLFIDVASESTVRQSFAEHIEKQFARWIALLDGAKKLEWLSSDVDAKTLTTFFWAASVGQVVSINSAQMDLSPEEIRGFVRRFIRHGRQVTLPGPEQSIRSASISPHISPHH
jgi:AcrR family transcriptional regulator